MTFQNAPWAIDGALLTSALARRAQFAATSGSAGVAQRDDLKVTQLDVPGVGVQIAPGVGLVLNEYQTSPSETYVTSNPGVHTIPSGEMPSSNPSAKSYIVAVVIGDPDFSQVGHPWMGVSDPPLGEETTFQYVRPTLIEVSAGATDIPGAFPALPLARLDIPANTTTITNSMIVDLRNVANPRTQQNLFVSPSNTWGGGSVQIPFSTSAPSQPWGETEWSPSVKIPSWAKRGVIITDISGAAIISPNSQVVGIVQTGFGTSLGPESYYDLTGGLVWSSMDSQRVNIRAVFDADVSSIAGTTKQVRLLGRQYSPDPSSSAQKLLLQGGTIVTHDVRFFEQ